MRRSIVTVFGGTGFLGRRVVRLLREREFSVRIASRHPDRGRMLFGIDDPQLQPIEVDIRNEGSVADALAGAYGAVSPLRGCRVSTLSASRHSRLSTPSVKFLQDDRYRARPGRFGAAPVHAVRFLGYTGRTQAPPQRAW
jgi:NAD(P)-dependent dehydrogenase (short-subunit alcohol dehydrogenase family)